MKTSVLNLYWDFGMKIKNNGKMVCNKPVTSLHSEVSVMIETNPELRKHCMEWAVRMRSISFSMLFNVQKLFKATHYMN